MNDDLTARKGSAVPARGSPGNTAYLKRRVVVLPPINLHSGRDGVPAPDGPAAAPTGQATGGTHGTDRRKFTFRIDPVRHAAFAAAAERRGVSRQRLLTEALDALLAKPGHANLTAAPADSAEQASAATLLPEGVAALPPHL